MKKTILFGAAALVMLAACNKQEAAQPESKTFTLSATVEQQVEPGTKSTLSGTTVSWTASTDVIKVYNADGSANTDLTAQSSGTSTTFSGGGLSGVPTVAIFPAGIASGYNGSVISFTLPSSQDYVANSFDADANVAVASVSASSLAFKNVCGTLKLSVTGNYTVSKIEVTGANNEKLWGAFKTTVATEPVLSVDGDPTTAEKTLTLNCGVAGVALNPETATVFYIVVPQGVFASGFTAKIYSKEAEDASETYTFTTVETASNNTVNRSHIRVMPKNDIVPPAYQKVEWLKMETAGAYIDTGVAISTSIAEIRVEGSCYFEDAVVIERDIVGSFVNSPRSGFIIGANESGAFSWTNGNKATVSTVSLSQWNAFVGVVTATINELTFGGDYAQNTWNPQTLYSSNTIKLFNCGQVDRFPTTPGDGIKTIAVYADDVAYIHCIPCKMKESPYTVGVYDTVNDQFLSNAGTGAFVVGSNINH